MKYANAAFTAFFMKTLLLTSIHLSNRTLCECISRAWLERLYKAARWREIAKTSSREREVNTFRGCGWNVAYV